MLDKELIRTSSRYGDFQSEANNTSNREENTRTTAKGDNKSSSSESDMAAASMLDKELVLPTSLRHVDFQPETNIKSNREETTGESANSNNKSSVSMSDIAPVANWSYPVPMLDKKSMSTSSYVEFQPKANSNNVENNTRGTEIFCGPSISESVPVPLFDEVLLSRSSLYLEFLPEPENTPKALMISR